MSLARDLFKSDVLAWRTAKRRNKNVIEILLENPTPFTAQNYTLEYTNSIQIQLEYCTFVLVYYGFLVDYYMQPTGEACPYHSEDKMINKYAGENIKDIYVNNVRWGIDENVLEVLLDEIKDKEQLNTHCQDCNRYIEWENAIRDKYCIKCKNKHKDLKTPIYFNERQEVYIAEKSLYYTKDNKLFTDSHVVIRDTLGKKARRELLRGHINKREELIRVV